MDKRIQLHIEKSRNGLMLVTASVAQTMNGVKAGMYLPVFSKKYLEVKKKTVRDITMSKVKQIRKDLKLLCKTMIRNMTCLRLQMAWSKQITLLVVSSSQYMMIVCCKSVTKIRI